MNCDELIEILRKAEGPQVEFKREFPEQAHAIAKEMVALANSGGGVLLMGVENDGTPRGISEPERVEERLSNIARGCTPSIHAAIDKFHLSKNIFLVYAKVFPATSVTLYQGRVYTRTGSTTHEASGEEVRRIVLRMERPPARSPRKTAQRTLKSGTTKARGLPRIPIMFQQGLIKPGDILTILNHDNSPAVVIDASKVRHAGQIMSYNEWGQKVTGWVALNIYEWAVLNGKTLGELRKKVSNR
jgi:hypothetical protein